MSEKKKVHFISLGCPKNRVDSEVMLGHLAQAGYTATDSAEGADLVVVNTCSFIEPAKEESVDTILDVGRLKEEGKVKTLVVAGCLSQRYGPQLSKEIPEVDHFLGTGNFESITQVVEGQQAHPALPIVSNDDHPRLKGKNKLVPYQHRFESKGSEIVIPDPDFTIRAGSPRQPTQAVHSQYVKVSEGCSNTCAFCIIPKLRGPQRSRTIEDIVQEATRLAASGTVEINLIAQDLCAYGNDRKPRKTLIDLLRALSDVAANSDNLRWIRCLYAYPKGLTDDVIRALNDSPYILPYLDMPLQHISDHLLRSMKRGTGGPATWDLVRKLRREVDGLTLRTTFITGLPGETEADFEELCEFVSEIEFERMGVFPYSPEEDTPAATMPDQVDPEIAERRRERLMMLQREISNQQQEALLGKRIEVLVEGVADETDLLLQARHRGQAPDIDGYTYVTEGTASPGDLVTIEVDQAGDYDVAGRMVE